MVCSNIIPQKKKKKNEQWAQRPEQGAFHVRNISKRDKRAAPNFISQHIVPRGTILAVKTIKVSPRVSRGAHHFSQRANSLFSSFFSQWAHRKWPKYPPPPISCSLGVAAAARVHSGHLLPPPVAGRPPPPPLESSSVACTAHLLGVCRKIRTNWFCKVFFPPFFC